MPSLVVDCSVAVAWCFEDEATPVLDALLHQVQAEGAIVPPLRSKQVGNVLRGAACRQPITRETMHERLALLDMPGIEADAHRGEPVWRSTVPALAETEALTFSAAVYLELPIRRGLRLATSDRAMRQAATRRRVAVVPPDPA